MLLYKLFWDDFCAWYLEIIKPAFGKGIDSVTHNQTINFFDQLTRLLHPFIPFITEELWQGLNKREDKDSIMIAQMPIAQLYSSDFISYFNMAKSAIVNIRSIRQAKGISPKEPLTLYVKGSLHEDMHSIVCKMANITSVMDMSKKGETITGSSFMVETTEFFVPLEGMVNLQEEISKIDAELKHLDGFLKSVNAKLSNEKFMASAPEQVVEIELKKRSDAGIKIEKLNKLKEDLSR